MFKIEANRAVLTQLLSYCPKSQSVDLPALESVLIEVIGEAKVRMTSTNLNQAVIVEMACRVVGKGKVVIPIKILSELIGSFTSDVVTLEEVKNSRVKVSTKNHQSTIYTLDSNDFPDIPDYSETGFINIKPDNLREGFAKTVLATSKDDTRPILGGVLMYLNQDNKFCFVATDSYRLSEVKFGVDSSEEIKKIVGLKKVIPTQIVQDIGRILQSNKDGETSILLEEDQVVFRLDGIVVISRVVDGQYPDYAKLIPSDSEVNFSIDKEEFLQTVKIASIFARESAGAISLEVDKETQQLNIDSVANQKGENHSSVAVSTNSDGIVNINSRYIIDALGSVDSDMVKVGFSKNLLPFVIRPEGELPYEHLHLIMPINL